MGSRKHILPTKEEQARLKFQKFRKQYMQKGSTLPRLNLSNINIPNSVINVKMQYFRPSDIMDKILSGSKLADLKLNSDLQKLIEDIAKKKFTESNNFDNVSPNNKYKILHDLKVKLIAEQKKANKYERVQPSKTNSVFLNNSV